MHLQELTSKMNKDMHPHPTKNEIMNDAKHIRCAVHYIAIQQFPVKQVRNVSSLIYTQTKFRHQHQQMIRPQTLGTWN
jgi:hypothetical protein